MKPSITFLMSFVASVTAFSPFAVARMVATNENAKPGVACKKDAPDFRVALQKTEASKTKPSGPVIKGQL